MTNHALAEALGLEVFCAGQERPVTAGYCGDLLSSVMGRAPQDSVWITIMTNNNVAAVALLCDVSCILLAQGSRPDAQLLQRAQREEICLLGSDMDAFSLACRIGALL